MRNDKCAPDQNQCDSNPCQHNGLCVDKPTGYDCLCINGWDGQDCEIRESSCSIVQDACPEDTFCVDTDNGFECKCPVEGCKHRGNPRVIAHAERLGFSTVDKNQFSQMDYISTTMYQITKLAIMLRYSVY